MEQDQGITLLSTEHLALHQRVRSYDFPQFVVNNPTAGMGAGETDFSQFYYEGTVVGYDSFTFRIIADTKCVAGTRTRIPRIEVRASKFQMLSPETHAVVGLVPMPVYATE